MTKNHTIHLIWDQLKNRAGRNQLVDIVKNVRQPINHELRVLLSVALEIECPSMDEVPRVLIHMREYHA